MNDKHGHKVDLDLENSWYKKAQKLLLNKKIIDVKWCNWDDEDYSTTGLVFTTNNDVSFFLSSDDKGNEPGALHWTSKDKIDGRDYGVLPRRRGSARMGYKKIKNPSPRRTEGP